MWEAAPTARAVVICFASFIGSSRGLEFEHQREVSSVSGEVMLSPWGDATSYLPDYRAAFACSHFRYPHHHRFILRWTFPLRGAIRAYAVPLKGHARLGLLYTPAVLFTHGPGTGSLGTHCQKSRAAFQALFG